MTDHDYDEAVAEPAAALSRTWRAARLPARTSPKPSPAPWASPPGSWCTSWSPPTRSPATAATMRQSPSGPPVADSVTVEGGVGAPSRFAA